MRSRTTVQGPGATASLRVAAVQMVFGKTVAENLGKIQDAARVAARRGARAVLFPECATTGYACDFGAIPDRVLREALASLSTLAAELDLHLLVGTPIPCGGKRYNALVVFDRRGRWVHTYAKCQLVEADRQWFVPGDGLSLFTIDGIPATSILCHERRYPELVRLPVMAGARIVFHPNAGMDALAVSRRKRGGRDGMVARAFENAVFYVFANSAGPQGGGKWSAGDSKIVAPDGTFLKLAGHREEAVLVADLDLSLATRKYALDSLEHPRFLASHWRRILPELRRRVRENDRRFRKCFS